MGRWAAGGLGPGAPATAGSGQQGVEAVVSAGVVPFGAAVDERSLVDEQGALGIVFSCFSWLWFLKGVGSGGRGVEITLSYLSKNSRAIPMKSMQLRNEPTQEQRRRKLRREFNYSRGKPIKGSVNTVDLQSISAKTPN